MEQKTRYTYVIDRFEDNGLAVIEAAPGTTFDVPRAWLPEGATEGDVLHLNIEAESETSTLHFSIDPVATEEQRQSAKKLRDSISQAPEGDLEL